MAFEGDVEFSNASPGGYVGEEGQTEENEEEECSDDDYN